ncbi:low-molecular-weight cysteine-rich 72 [Perilla frutescens var. hirtella]|nr:low-molecular-weight cysteine-rich 72 [Perilla frutescens var. hirtella]
MMAMVGEASLCESPSTLFKGACFRSSNCGTICEKEGFLNGRCKFFRCICSKDCNSGGGGGGEGGGGGGDGGPPGDGPPNGGNGPPGEDPPEGPPDGGGDGGDGGDGGTPTPSASHQKMKDAYLNMN